MKALVDPAFKFQAKQLDDIEKQRKAAANRIRIFTQPVDVADEDGLCRGFGYPENHPAVMAAQNHLNGLIEAEKEFKKVLVKSFEKNSPLIKVVTDTYGLGAPMVARLLGEIGDPYIKPSKIDIETGELIEPERVRRISELFSYCGLTPQARKKAGQKVFYSPAAQSILWNMAEAVQKIPEGKSPLKDVWTHYKNHYSQRVDDKGKPWNWTHVKLASHRKVGREILKLLYAEAQRVHTES